ncbi:MAG TPA: AtpZ/AtpI family protein [Bacillota bacterium]
MDASKNGRKRFLQAYSATLSFAFNLLGGILIGYYGGGYLDRWLGTSPWLTLVLVTLGTVAAFQSLLRQLRNRPGSS